MFSHEKRIDKIYITLFRALLVTRVMAWLIKKNSLIFLGNEALLQQSFSCEALPQQSSKSRKIFLRPFQNFQRTSPKHRHRFIQFSKRTSMLHLSCLALPGYAYNSACAFPFLSSFC